MLFAAVGAYGQNYSIKGYVVDPNKESLEDATIHIESAKDSSLIDYTISDRNGAFKIEGKTKESKVHFYVTYTGFEILHKEIVLKNEANVNLDTLRLKVKRETLNEVRITAKRAPITIKTDTLEFNAASFKTKENANLEELLKKLPGVKVDNKGNIEVNGKPVKRILVNGKPFFGSDPLIATKNLPKYIIDKIQVVNTKTKSEEFTGETGDTDNKTINITVEKDKNRGFFGNLTAGAGANDRYQLKGLLNYFNEELQVSVIGNSNNINSNNFNFKGSGITELDDIGFNLNNEWNDKVDLDVGYIFKSDKNISAYQYDKLSILPDDTFGSNSESTNERDTDGHKLDFKFSAELDSLTLITVKPTFNFQDGNRVNRSMSTSFKEIGNPINTSETMSNSDVKKTDIYNQFNITRKFGANKSFIRLDFTNRHTTNNEGKYLISNRKTFNNGAITNEDIQDQYVDQEGSDNNYKAALESNLTLTDKLMLRAGYEFTKSDRKNARLLFDKSATTDAYDILNEDLSNEFYSKTYEHRPEMELEFKGEKTEVSFTLGLQDTQIVNENVFRDTQFKSRYSNWLSRARISRNLGQNKSVSFSYKNNWIMPSIFQLQPVANTTDPLNITIGNPNLKPSLLHYAYIYFNSYDYNKKLSLFLNLGANLNQDKVISATSTDLDLVKTTTYTNIDGAYNLSGRIKVNKTYKFQKDSKLSLGVGLSTRISRDIGLSNGVTFNSDALSVIPEIEVEYDLNEFITISPEYKPSFNQTHYGLNDRVESYTNQEFKTNFACYWPKKMIFETELNYNKVGNTVPGFANSFVLWNMSLGYKILDELGTLKFEVFDLLNQNIGLSRTTENDYILEQKYLVVKQYVMLSFIYKPRKFVKKNRF